SGRRLFPDGGAVASLRLVDTRTTTTGVLIATYAATL
ncbi:MAG: dihydrofolate reductase, partial [Chloroflexi bacterium]